MTEKEIRYTQVVELYKPTIYAVCRMFFSSKANADDAFQEILIRIWRGFDGFRNLSSKKTWIYRIALNTCITLSKSSKLSIEAVPLSEKLIEEDTNQSEESFQMLEKSIRHLSFVDRSILLMRLEGLSYDEIAQVLGISKDNVSVKLVRIKEQLSLMLKTTK